MNSDIGEIPAVTDAELREKCVASFRDFCETVFPKGFYIKWSEDHLDVLQRIQDSLDNPKIYANALPIGSGNTSLALAAVLYAIVTGRRRYVTYIDADGNGARNGIECIVHEIESNPMLLALFPEAVVPFRALRNSRLASSRSQAHEGQRTHIALNRDRIVFATIQGAPCSNATIEACGILGRMAGRQRRLQDGSIERPDYFVLNNPQTDRSAHSAIESARRVAVINGEILNLSRETKAISGIAMLTCIAKGDVADQLLDRTKFPSWNGKRYKTVYRWPDSDKLWVTYRNIVLEDNGDLTRATKFYAENREEMDKGSHVAWPERFVPERELSALQHAYNKRILFPNSFEAEYQNSP